MRRIFLTLCFLMMMLPLALWGQNLQTNDIIAITYKNGNTTHYLSTNGNAITDLTTPTTASLWVVTKNASRNTFSIKNLANNQYAVPNVGITSRQLALNQTARYWSVNSSNQFYYEGLYDYYIGYNSGWGNLQTQNNRRPTIVKYTSSVNTTYGNYQAEITPNSQVVSKNGGNHSFEAKLRRDKTTTTTYTATGYATITNPVVIREEVSATPIFSIADNTWATVTATGDNASVVFTQNTATTARTNTLTATYNINNNNNTYTATASIQQDANTPDPSDTPTTITFHHKAGASNRALENGRQGVHTYNATIYMGQGEQKTLPLPENDFRGYCRWYNYSTDGNIKLSGLNATNFPYTTAGYIRTGNANTNSNATNAAYRYQGTAVQIACDVSNYYDYSGTVASGNFTEPTLSYRAIFDIRSASEVVAKMESCTSTSNVYETHKLVVPSGKTINLALDNTFDNYYFGDYATGSMSNANNWHLTDGTDNVTATKQNNRVFRFNSGSTTGTKVYYVTYTGNNTTYYVAKYEITVVDASKTISAANGVVTGYDQASLQRIYQYDPENNILPATQDFDSFTGSPLEWDECSYGFSTYSGVARNSGGGTQGTENGATGTYAYWGEYAILSSASGFGNPTLGTPNGQFLYIDAASAPGTVANLKIDGQLCDGAKMLFTARIADLNNNSNVTRPNLNFVVTGIKYNPGANEQAETIITTFTTGDVTKGGSWYQYVFELVRNDNTTYDEFRLKIVNNGTNTSGNDFAIDDIQIWKGKAPVLPYQGEVKCDQTSDKITSVVRVNYTNTVAANTDFYYQWRDESTAHGTTPAQPLQLNYLVNPATTGKTDLGTKYGKIGSNLFRTYPDATFESTMLNQNGGYFQKLSDLITAAVANTGSSDMYYGYVTETVNNTSAYVLYIVHVTDQMKKGIDYTVELVAVDGNKDPMFGRLAQGACGFQSAITVNVPQALRIDGEVTYENVNGDLCAQQIHELKPILKINVVDDDAQEVNEVEALVRADWLKFHLGTGAKNPSAYDSTTIVTAIYNFRDEFPNATDVKTVKAQGKLSLAELQVVQSLVADGYLVLYENAHNEYLSAGESVNLTIFPINGTVTAKDGVSPLVDKYGNPLPGANVCLGQMTTTISAKPTATGTLKFGKPSGPGISYDGADAEADKRVAATRLYVSEIRSKGIFMGIRNKTNVQIQSIELVPDFTTDPAITSEVSILGNTYDFSGFNTTNGLTLTPAQLSAAGLFDANGDPIFKEGYEYAIQATFGIVSGADQNCQTGTNYFLVKVTPSYALWTPMGGNTAWNNDANWSTADSQGNIIRHSGFIPGVSTNVIVANEDNNVYPILPDAIDGKELGYQKYVDYDYYFANATAHDIYFDTKAMMGNQQVLKYTNAYIDMALPATRWNLVGMPMQGMYSGDFYVPGNNDNSELFGSATYDGNYNVRFWQKMYNTVTAANHNVSWSGTTQSTILQDQGNWTTNFNGVAQQYNAGAGTAVWPYDAAKGINDEVIVRLPKTEDKLYYYSYGNPTGKFENTPRTDNSVKLAYDKDNYTGTYTLTVGNGDYFIFGNPTMAYIDIEEFLKANRNLAPEYHYFHAEKGNSQAWTDYAGTNTNLNTTDYGDLVPGYIAPQRAIMVKASNSVNTSITVTVPTSAVTTKPVAKTVAAPASTLYMKSVASGHTSYASISEQFDANDNYNEEEDAKTMLGDNGLTPSSLYSVADSRALAVNTLRNINNVPVAVYAESATTATLSFEGADSFEGCRLYLHDMLSNTSTLIENDEPLTIYTTKEGEAIRYFIQKVVDETTGIDVTENGGINIFVQPDGSITVASNDMLKEVNVYNAAGQRILHQTANDQFVGLSLPAGVYAVQALTEHESYSQKVVIK
ncbi:MAG: T9SS type A sorting domain-containing protein [Paludibacteraceae bacterium]|nr:T9SS type A sorting domain-containing protein [Paludibacteraceae bacterium]